MLAKYFIYLLSNNILFFILLYSKYIDISEFTFPIPIQFVGRYILLHT